MAGAGLLWLGWNGFNGGDSYYAGANASAAVLNTNLCTAVAVMVWIAWDYIFREKPSLIGVGQRDDHGLGGDHARGRFRQRLRRDHHRRRRSTIVWMAIRFLSRAPVFRHVDDTLGVIYTHGIAGSDAGVCWSGLLRRPERRRVHRRARRVQPARASRDADQRELDAAALAGRGRGMGDRLHGGGDVHHPEAGRDLRARCDSPTRSWRSAITRSTATRSTPRTCPRSAARTRPRGSHARRPPARGGAHSKAGGRMRHPSDAFRPTATVSGPASAGSPLSTDGPGRRAPAAAAPAFGGGRRCRQVSVRVRVLGPLSWLRGRPGRLTPVPPRPQ